MKIKGFPLIKFTRNNRFIFRIEGFIFIIGLGLLIASIFFFTSLYYESPDLANKIAGMIAADLFGGRGTSIPVGLNLGLSRTTVIIVSAFVDLIWVFLFYPLFVFFYRHLVELKLLGRAFKAAQATAERHRRKIEPFGAIGIAIFIWFPFLMTGALIGAIIGFLIGLRTWVNLFVVVCATVLASVSWAFAFEYMISLAEGINKVLPLAGVLLVLGSILFYRLKRLIIYARQWHEKRRNHLRLKRSKKL